MDVVIVLVNSGQVPQHLAYRVRSRASSHTMLSWVYSTRATIQCLYLSYTSQLTNRLLAHTTALRLNSAALTTSSISLPVPYELPMQTTAPAGPSRTLPQLTANRLAPSMTYQLSHPDPCPYTARPENRGQQLTNAQSPNSSELSFPLLHSCAGHPRPAGLPVTGVWEGVCMATG